MHFIIGTAAEDVADMTMKVAPVDLDRSILLAQLLTRTLSNMAQTAQPISLNGVLKATIKLALWSLSVELAEITGTLLIGITTVSRQFTEDALERMERTTQDVFSEVSDRVVAFDWVEPDLRELIPLLRMRLADAAESAAAVAVATSSRARRSRPD
jgi:hypothetical protein